MHGDRRIARLEADGKFTTLADRYDGKRLNSPNDLNVRPNGDVPSRIPLTAFRRRSTIRPAS